MIFVFCNQRKRNSRSKLISHKKWKTLKLNDRMHYRMKGGGVNSLLQLRSRNRFYNGFKLIRLQHYHFGSTRNEHFLVSIVLSQTDPCFCSRIIILELNRDWLHVSRMFIIMLPFISKSLNSFVPVYSRIYEFHIET